MASPKGAGFLFKDRARASMARKLKTGRRATDDRARAASWAKNYRLAQASPDGRYCLNPEDASEFQIFFDIADIDPLLQALESFAEHGTFELMHNIEPFVMRMEMRALRSAGMTYEEAIAKLAEKFNTSESTITRRVRRTVKT
ncbi:MAG: hypothetical protein H7293_22020 [Candidatus Saccharibacteria bacterium]|nr:hypothetical protein [Rhodoferax sp.]